MLRVAMFMLAAVTVVAAQTSSPATASKDSLAFLAGLKGKTPSEAKVFAQPAMKARLSTLLKKDAALVPERFQSESPIKKEGDVVTLVGNKAHAGGSDDALIVVNTKSDELWVWLRVKGALRRFGPTADPTGLPEDAAVALRNMTGK